jgi:SAM-dependent methyltransferase
MQEILRKLRRDPIRAPLRGLYKTLVASRKYRSGESYDARAYWGDRFERYGQSLRGPGDEALSHEENEAEYAEAARVLVGLCRDQGVDFESASVLDIGCGTGFYAGILQELGVRKYIGVDITDVLFPELRERFPGFEFLRQDVTEEQLDGEFDLILMIDVIEHIVDESKLTAALANVEQALAPAGVFVLAPVAKAGRRRFFYVRLWTLEEVRSRLQGFMLTDPIPFRTERITAARRALPPPS